MRRSLRDNESIPIPLEWNIMKFVAQIDKRRRKQFGYSDPVGQTTSRGRGRKKVILVFLRRNLKNFSVNHNEKTSASEETRPTKETKETRSRFGFGRFYRARWSIFGRDSFWSRGWRGNRKG